MNLILVKCLFALATLSKVISVDLTTSNSSITINKGDPFELACNCPNAEIKGCLFKNPVGKSFILWAGTNYEGGRIAQKGKWGSTCAITINKANNKSYN